MGTPAILEIKDGIMTFCAGENMQDGTCLNCGQLEEDHVKIRDPADAWTDRIRTAISKTPSNLKIPGGEQSA